MDYRRALAPPARFVLQFAAWSLGLFGILRLTWVEFHLVWPVTLAQGALAAAVLGTPRLPVATTLACSGADAVAICLGAILAYPSRWSLRLAGAAGGLLVIVGLNVFRIASLGQAVASSPATFEILHVYVWPAALTLAIAGYVYAWTRAADRRDGDHETGRFSTPATPALWHMGRFVFLTAIFMMVFVAAAPRYLESGVVLAIAGLIARAGSAILGSAGIHAAATANLLATDRGAVVVTQECVVTPLIPVYLASVCAFSTTWRRFAAGLVATVPLFVGLGIVRLLVVALPWVAASPLFLVHAFYQLLLGAVVVFLFARWRDRTIRALPRGLAGMLAGAAFIILLGPWYTQAITYPVAIPASDPQYAIAFLPSFQVGLYLALWVAVCGAAAWPRFAAGVVLLAGSQIAALAVLHAVASRWALLPQVRDVRAWAVAGPLLAFMVTQSRTVLREPLRE